jgi:starch phosphorylase
MLRFASRRLAPRAGDGAAEVRAPAQAVQTMSRNARDPRVLESEAMRSMSTDAMPRPMAPDQAASLESSFRRHVRYSLGQEWRQLSRLEQFQALGLAVRDVMIDRLLETEARYRERNVKQVYYLSIEYLIGRSLENNLANLGLLDTCRGMLAQVGLKLEDLVEQEADAGLGNGGLGRLASCFLDSLATLDMPGRGYGIHYEYGLFQQSIHQGYQSERPDSWLINGTPWAIQRPDEAVYFPVYGRVEDSTDFAGNYNPLWLDFKLLCGVPHDFPIVGYGGRTVNVLRLYAARSLFEFDLQVFNQGDYIRAVEDKIASETVSKVLYPSDTVRSGQELRLIQEYFLVASALRDIVKRFLETNEALATMPAKVAIQLNDTHPSLAVVEMMRILVDEKSMLWDQAWEITRATMAYTNHTLLPEALERWPVPLFERVLPRHLQILYEINHRFLQEVAARHPGDAGKLSRMSLIEESSPKQVRMANLAIVGSHSINGVSALHSELIKSDLVPDFHELWPARFNNKTNGITQRRWLLLANPRLADLLRRTVGDAWIKDLGELREVERHATDRAFADEFLAIKRANKEALARLLEEATGVAVDPASLFDIQAKRIHEYKRQLLKVMHVIHEYLALVEDGVEPVVPRTVIVAGKAAPGYWAAKQIIKLVHSVGQVVNRDRRVGGRLRLLFAPDYRVTLAQRIIPAADLSEQISTAGKEASGTGNMKFALNGALTIGTLDGANVEIREEVGDENIYIFGLTAPEIHQMRRAGSYHPRRLYETRPQIARVMDALRDGRFCPEAPELFRWMFDRIVDGGDEYFHLADLDSYVEAHQRAAADFRDRRAWARKAIANVARIGKFSSDRTISEYARDIWGIEPAGP